MRRAAGAVLFALVVLSIAVTPLSATFRPAYFDVRYVDRDLGTVLMATLEDQTGLVAAIDFDPGAAATTTGSTTRLIVAWLGGCENPTIYLRFSASDGGYVLSERTTGADCQLDIGLRRTFVIALRAPVDATTVQIVHV